MAVDEERQPLMTSVQRGIPTAPWTTAIPSQRNGSVARFFPQAIAHRGYKAVYPENTIEAFQAAADVGAHAIETDLQLSSDGVVVLSHDGSLKRCYGVDKKIGECTWEYLSTLETLREPHVKLPRLTRVLEFLSKPGLEKMWLYLDAKIGNNADELFESVARDLREVPGSVPWNQRIVIGGWSATFLESAHKILPTYPLTLITFSTLYARYFMRIPNLGFNMIEQSLFGVDGWAFLRKARSNGRPVFTYTPDTEAEMEWCIRRNLDSRGGRCGGGKPYAGPLEEEESEKAVARFQGDKVIDGVITDDPKLFLEVCQRIEDEYDGKVEPRRRGLGQCWRDCKFAWVEWLKLQIFGSLIYVTVRYKGTLDFPGKGSALFGS